MTTDFTNRDSKLTFLFPEEFEVSPFNLVELKTHQVHVLTFTPLGEQPGSRLNQALQKAISDKNHVQVTAIRRDGATCIETVVVNETEWPNNYRLSVIGPAVALTPYDSGF